MERLRQFPDSLHLAPERLVAPVPRATSTVLHVAVCADGGTRHPPHADEAVAQQMLNALDWGSTVRPCEYRPHRIEVYRRDAARG